MGIICFWFSIFAGITAILAKIGIKNIDSNLATAIRTIIILIFSWLMVFIVGSFNTIMELSINTIVSLILSGLATGMSWLCYYKALQDGQASIVVPIDKLSIVITILFSYFILKEKLNRKSVIGLVGIVIGTLLLLI